MFEQDENPCIHCEVETCIHNNGNCMCSAPEIRIKNRMALLGEETMCGTFEEEL